MPTPGRVTVSKREYSPGGHYLMGCQRCKDIDYESYGSMPDTWGMAYVCLGNNGLIMSQQKVGSS